MHALIIEDEALIAMTIEEILRDCGFTSFDIAGSSDEAIACSKRRCPDLITADIRLQPGSGIDAVHAICSGPPVPVIFITGSPNEAAQMPQYSVIVKPFTPQAVTAAVRSAMMSSTTDDASRSKEPMTSIRPAGSSIEDGTVR